MKKRRFGNSDVFFIRSRLQEKSEKRWSEIVKLTASSFSSLVGNPSGKERFCMKKGRIETREETHFFISHIPLTIIIIVIYTKKSTH